MFLTLDSAAFVIDNLIYVYERCCYYSCVRNHCNNKDDGFDGWTFNEIVSVFANSVV